ncbi:MAG: DNA-processing protein DprA [Methanoregula sp.]|nr:DNA-processing protein DprA [Methanoregula sp.]
MHSRITQTILTLQQLKLNDKTIETILQMSDSQSIDSKSLFELCNNNSEIFTGKNTLPTSDSLNQAWNIAQDIIQSSIQNNVEIFSKFDNGFPALLKEIPHSPLLLHVKGNTSILNDKCIAVVGTRNPTSFGEGKAFEVSEGLANEGYTIVSGLATGVDAAAHAGALKANGHTIAVLAHGLQMIYPAANKALAQKILKKNGALVSEYPWHTTLEPWKLVQRDRIQSGLSLGVFVIETGIKGGTMHTVDFCIKQNRLLIVLQHPPEWDRDTKIWGNKELIKKFENSKNFVVYRENSDYLQLSEWIKAIKQDASKSLTINCYVNVVESSDLIRHTVQEPVSGLDYAGGNAQNMKSSEPNPIVMDSQNKKTVDGKPKKQQSEEKGKPGEIPKDQTTF